jgi:hypothetical protein
VAIVHRGQRAQPRALDPAFLGREPALERQVFAERAALEVAAGAVGDSPGDRAVARGQRDEVG